jgi:hypothetical protein
VCLFMLFLFTKYSMVKNKYLISQSSQFYNYSNLHPKGVLIAEAVARFLYGRSSPGLWPPLQETEC